MGLLSEPSRNGGITTFIHQHRNKLSALSYIAGVIWLVSLSWEPQNARTYFSENALLPGLVQREFQQGNAANQIYESLKYEASKSENIPYAWLQAQFRQLGLDVYLHNFTLHYPFGSKPRFQGNNLYAILRAPRAASLEALVLSSPYRDQSSVHGSTLPGIALMLSLAGFFKRQVYWAKDIIFLIAEHELVGFQAWLEAYHSSPSFSHVLDCGHLPGRSGAIQAALNLEISSERISHLDIKVEGLNGQLPNLDLFNLLVEITNREGVQATFHGQANPVETESWEGFQKALQTMLLMMSSQGSGAPSGAHGLFHRYAIQALSIKSESEGFDMPKATFTHMGRVIEGVFRSLNNLLERFHQSFFFYLLPASRRYVSIGLYMPAFALIAAPVLIIALSLYLSLDETSTDSERAPKNKQVVSQSLWATLPTVMATQCLGYGMLRLPEVLDMTGLHWGYSFKESFYYGTLISLFIIQTLPFLWLRTFRNEKEKKAHMCVSLLCLGAFLHTFSLVNISAAAFLAIIYVPIAVMNGALKSWFLRWFHSLLLFVIQPFILSFLIILVSSIVSDPGRPMKIHLKGSLEGHQNLLLWNAEDYYLYANYNFIAYATFLTPVWLQMWYLVK